MHRGFSVLMNSFICSTVSNASWRVNCCENGGNICNYLCNRPTSTKIWLRSFASVDYNYKSLYTMLNNVRQVFKIRVVFHTFYFWNDVGDPHFLHFLAHVANYLNAVKKLKISIDWKILAGTSLKGRNLIIQFICDHKVAFQCLKTHGIFFV